MQTKSEANVGDISMKKQNCEAIEVGHKWEENENYFQRNGDEVQDINCKTPFSLNGLKSDFKLKKWKQAGQAELLD